MLQVRYLVQLVLLKMLANIILGIPNLAFDLQSGYTIRDRKKVKDADSWTYLAASNFRIADNLWLRLSVGGDTEDEEIFALSRLQWAFQQKQSIAVPPEGN